MPLPDILNRNKMKEVLKGKELLRVESLHKQEPKNRKNVRIAYITFIFLVCLISSIWLFWSGPFVVLLMFMALLISTYALVIYIVCVYLAGKGRPVIFTDKGVVIPCLAANFWSEIESYTWEEYTGWKRVPGPSVFSVSGGKCLRLNLNIDWSTNWSSTYGRNIMATNLNFFSPEQISSAEDIFMQFGIREER